MLKSKLLWRVPASIVFATCLAGAHPFLSVPGTDSSPSWSIWDLPILSWFAPAAPVEPLQWEAPQPPPPPCLVAPLSEVTDLEALEFETAAGTEGVVNTSGLTPGASRALTRFEQFVVSAGGRIELKSAYRPATYQAHLQELWDKWMLELRYNVDPACSELRVQVADEFTRHELLETQRPVSFSDHTRGISFDAAVMLPARARLGRRRVGIDVLARMAGIRRPAIAADPVHFRLM